MKVEGVKEARERLLLALQRAVQSYGIDRPLIVGGHDLQGMTAAFARFQEHAKGPGSGWREAAEVLELIEARDREGGEVADVLAAGIVGGFFHDCAVLAAQFAQVELVVLPTPPWPWHDLWRALHELDEELPHGQA